MSKFRNIIQVIGGWSIIMIPVILLLFIWFDSSLIYKLLLSDLIIFFTCLILDKATE